MTSYIPLKRLLITVDAEDLALGPIEEFDLEVTSWDGDVLHGLWLRFLVGDIRCDITPLACAGLLALRA